MPDWVARSLIDWLAWSAVLVVVAIVTHFASVLYRRMREFSRPRLSCALGRHHFGLWKTEAYLDDSSSFEAANSEGLALFVEVRCSCLDCGAHSSFTYRVGTPEEFAATFEKCRDAMHKVNYEPTP